MARVGRPVSDTARRDESRLRELDRKARAAGDASLELAVAVDATPRGVRARAARTTNVSPITGAAWYQLVTMAVPLSAGRRYEVSARHGSWVDGANPSVMNSVICWRTDGVTPTAADPVLIRSGTYLPAGTVTVQSVLDGEYIPTDDVTLSLTLLAQGVAGAGTYGVQADNGWQVFLVVRDAGAA